MSFKSIINSFIHQKETEYKTFMWKDLTADIRSQIFKQSKQIVYKTPLTLSQANQTEYYNSYVYSDLNWHHTHASL